MEFGNVGFSTEENWSEYPKKTLDCEEQGKDQMQESGYINGGQALLPLYHHCPPEIVKSSCIPQGNSEE